MGTEIKKRNPSSEEKAFLEPPPGVATIENATTKHDLNGKTGWDVLIIGRFRLRRKLRPDASVVDRAKAYGQQNKKKLCQEHKHSPKKHEEKKMKTKICEPRLGYGGRENELSKPTSRRRQTEKNRTSSCRGGDPWGIICFLPSSLLPATARKNRTSI